MSTCISKHGEFGSHETDDEFTCRLCGAFDETGALTTIAALRACRAIAWDRGYASGFSNAMRRMSDEPDAPTTPNPYRSTTPTTDQPEETP